MSAGASRFTLHTENLKEIQPSLIEPKTTTQKLMASNSKLMDIFSPIKPKPSKLNQSLSQLNPKLLKSDRGKESEF